MFSGVEYSDCVILVGINPRLEAPLLNLRLQHAFHDRKATIGIVGLKMNLGYRTQHLGASPDTISNLADGKHAFCEGSCFREISRSEIERLRIV